MKKVILLVDGMTCSACSNGLEKYLNKQNGIINASVNLVYANVLIYYDEKILNLNLLEKYIENAGFKSKGIFNSFKEDKQNKTDKIYLLIYSFLSIFLMYISMGHIINDYKIHGIILLFLSSFYLIYGFNIFKSGFKNLIHLYPNMDTLITIGVISSYLYSVYNLLMTLSGNIKYANNLYFESSAIMIYFVKLGRFIDKRSKDKTKDAIKDLSQITPNEAVIIKNNKEMIVTLDEIKKGDILISKCGEKIAVDGEIIEGKSYIDQSFITGESKPVKKTIKDSIIAGSINLTSTIKYVAQKIGKESTVSQMIRLIMEASNTKPKISRLADNICRYFVYIIIIIALLTFSIYLLIGFDLNTSIITFINILVIACPCSLGLATPLAVVVSNGIFAKNKILVKNSEVIENASKIKTIVFDKTGTLTYAKLKIYKVFNYSNLTNDFILQIVASIEKESVHPISNVFKSYIIKNKLENLNTSDIKNLPGYGIIGKINNNKIIIGNQKILSKYKIENNHILDEKELLKKSCLIVYVVFNNEIVALIGIKDKIRKEAKEVINELKMRNIDIVLLTGDNKETANEVAKELKIDNVIADVLPKEKSEIIKKIQKENKIVAMCGDGINDSLALTVSDIAISIKNATDIAINSADVILINNNLKSIIKLIDLSNKTIRKIKQNLFWAFFYNILMIPISIGILRPIGIIINPEIASLAMMLSSLTVTINTLTLKKEKI